MANQDCTLEQFLNEKWGEAWEKAAEPTAEIFGNSETLPDDELELVFSSAFSKLTRPAKIHTLAELRARKGIGWN